MSATGTARDALTHYGYHFGPSLVVCGKCHKMRVPASRAPIDQSCLVPSLPASRPLSYQNWLVPGFLGRTMTRVGCEAFFSGDEEER